jgi:hypothetical protein
MYSKKDGDKMSMSFDAYERKREELIRRNDAMHTSTSSNSKIEEEIEKVKKILK